MLRFATKRDVNGNRYYLIIDPDKKIYSRETRGWFNKEDYTELTKTDRRKLMRQLDETGFTETANYL